MKNIKRILFGLIVCLLGTGMASAAEYISLSAANARLQTDYDETTKVLNGTNRVYADFKINKADTSSAVHVSYISFHVNSNYPVKSVQAYSTECSDCFEETSLKNVFTGIEDGDYFVDLQGAHQNTNFTSLLISIELDTSGADDLGDKVVTTLSDITYKSSADGEIYSLDANTAVNNVKVYNDYDILGDWNGDGKTDLVDLVRYRLYLAGSNDMAGETKAFGRNKKNLLDFLIDGEIDTTDLVLLRKKLINAIDYDYVMSTREQIGYKVVSYESLGIMQYKYKSRGYYVEQRADGKTVVTISSGEKPTGGYDIEVTSVNIDNSDNVSISVTESNPPSNMFTTQSLTYPAVQVVLDNEPNSIHVVEASTNYQYEEKAIEDLDFDLFTGCN